MDDKTTKSVKTNKKPMADQSTQRYMPFSEIRDNLIIMKDWSTRMVLKVQAMNFNLKSIEEQDAIIYWYQRFLNTLRFPIEIMVRSLKVDIESYINKLKNLAVKQENPLLQEQTYRYIDFLVNLVDMAQIMKKDFYIIIPFDVEEEKSVRETWLFWIFRTFWKSLTQEESVSSIRSKRRSVESYKKWNIDRLLNIKSTLESIWLKAEEIRKDDLLKLLISYYNPKVNTELKIKEVEGLS